MFRRKPKEPTLPPEWMIVGLGNPGPQYRGTRHNVGFDVVERLAAANGIKLDRGKQRAMIGEGSVNGVSVALVKPMTYMNLSGQSVAPLMKSFSLKPDRVLVIADDLDMQTGKVRLRAKGSAGGHNGHKSIISALGTEEYPRLKIGIGRSDDATIEHVLSTFKPDERSLIDEACRLSVECCEELIANGWDAALKTLERAKQKD